MANDIQHVSIMPSDSSFFLSSYTTRLKSSLLSLFPGKLIPRRRRIKQKSRLVASRPLEKMDLLPHDSTRPAQQLKRNNEVVQPTPPAPQALTRTTLPPYYVERPSVTRHTATRRITIPGPRVPLIPIDQLPAGVEIIGVPRELNPEQTVSLTNLGIVPKGEQYEVYVPQARALPLPPPHEPSPSSKPASSRMDPTASPFVSKYLNVFVPVSSSSDEGRAKADTASAGTGEARKTTVSTRPATGLNQRLASPTLPDTPRDNPYPIRIGFVETGGINERFRKEARHPAERLLRAAGASTSRPAAKGGNRPLLSYASRSSSTSSSSPTERAKRPSTSTRHRSSNNSNAKKSKSHPSSSTQKTRKVATATAKSKVYCRNWCQRGTCRYDEECRYVHEMPVTAHELREVGLVDYPSWWLKNIETVSRHIDGLKATAARHNRYHADDGGGVGDINDPQITPVDNEHLHYPQRHASHTTAPKDRKRSNSWDGTSTSPSPSFSDSGGDWSNAEGVINGLLLRTKPVSPPPSGTGQKPHVQPRPQVQTTEKEYLLPATKMETQPYHNQHRNERADRPPRAQVRAVSARPRAATRTPDLFEREVALAAATEQEKRSQEQVKRGRLEGEAGPVQRERGGDEEENLLEI